MKLYKNTLHHYSQNKRCLIHTKNKNKQKKKPGLDTVSLRALFLTDVKWQDF